MAAPTIPYTIPGTVDQDRPVMECRLAFESARTADPLAWVDFTEQLLSFEISRGSENELTQIDAGTAMVVINDPDRDLDPFNTGSPYDVKPRRRLWLRSMWNGEATDQFYGWTGSFRPEWPSDFQQVAVVPARDGLSLLAGDNMPVSNPPRDSYAEVVLFDEPIIYWRMGGQTKAIAEDATGNTNGVVDAFAGVVGDPPLIVGDTDTSVTLPSTGSIEGPSDGWPLESGHAEGITIEVWYQPSSVTGTTNIFASPETSTTSGVVAVLVQNVAGVPTFVLRTGAAPGSATTLASSMTMAVGSTYHIAATYDGANMRIRVNDAETSVAKTGSIPFAAQTSSYFPDWGFGKTHTVSTALGTYDEAVIYPRAVTGARLSAHYEAGTVMGHHQAPTDEHIEVALEDSGISFVPRRLRAGQRDIQPVFFHGQSRRSWWDDAVVVEGDESLAFFAKDGAAVFLDNDHRSVSPWTTVQAVFDDDGTDIAYLGVEMDDGESFLFNDVRRTASGGTLQWTFDTASIGEYDRIVMDDGETLNVDDADALAEVTAKLAKYKDPQPRIISLALAGTDPEQLEQLLRRELGDKVQVRRRPSGVGVVIDQTSFVRRISISGERGGNDFWSGSLAVSPL